MGGEIQEENGEKEKETEKWRQMGRLLGDTGVVTTEK